ncbi:MAG: isopentenyl-diphosphate delta-isomerase [Bacteroidota bacterium]
MNKQTEDPLIKDVFSEDDPGAEERKRDHIELAFKSQVAEAALDGRFYYEPLMAAHPEEGSFPPIDFLGKSFRYPIWVSSMTGGTELARTINHNLARACQEFGIGMGLGSCRSLLYSDEYLADFDVRAVIGDSQPLYANLGIAQVEQLLEQNEFYRIPQLLDKLKADGLIIHVNPFQEWLQPEGDKILYPPIDTIRRVLDKLEQPLIVKEVGQGMGYKSLKALFELPLAAVDFAANGGTNFSKLEMLRSDAMRQKVYEPLAMVGHSAEDMVHLSNQIKQELGERMLCQQVIISGGVRQFLDGYYLINKLALPSVYGQASGFLKYARGSYDELREYVQAQVRGLELAYAYLSIRK